MSKNILNLIKIRNLHQTVDRFINKQGKQDLANILNTLQYSFDGDGKGLSSGIVIDKFIGEYFSRLDRYQEYHRYECDLMIDNTGLSLKK
jgi:hypothetical protein